MRQSVYHERPDMSYSTIGPTAETFDYTIYQTRYPDGNSQILAQHDGSFNATRYFYLHDRLGSVRQVIDTMGNVVNHYTYRPFGELYPAPDFEQTVNNPFKFTGQFYDFEINEYYLRARMYDPHIGRFTARDPVRGKFTEPLTLHTYLYCRNDPINRIDPRGELDLSYTGIMNNIFGRSFLSAILNSAISGIRAKVFGGDPWKAAAAGFVGGFAGGIASLSSSGYIAAAVTGGVGSGFESALRAEGITKDAALRILTDTIAGAIAGMATHGFSNLMADKLFSGAPLWVQAELDKDAKQIVAVWNAVAGGIGGNTWMWISNIALGDWGYE